MLNAIRDNLNDLLSSEDKEDGEDEDGDKEDTGHGKMSEDDEPGWVMGTISKTVQHCMESIQSKEMRHDEPMQPGWGDVTNYFGARDMKYEKTELKIPAVGKPQTDSTAATPSWTKFGELMQALVIIPGQSELPQVTSRLGCSQMRLGSEKPQADYHVVPPMPTAVPDSSQIAIAKPVQTRTCYPCI
jgi:hypothetical protein